MTDRASVPPEESTSNDITAEEDAQLKTRRLLADMQALSSRIAAIQEIATAINQSLELDEILNIVGHQAKWLLDFDNCSVCLVEGEISQKKLVTLFGPPVTWETIRGENQDPIEAAINTKQAQLIKEGEESANFQSLIVLPMSIEDKVLGTINFSSKKANVYNLDDLRIAYLLALQLASAIHNARQFKQIRSLYRELEGAYKNLRSLEEMRDQLIHMLAHDLRNPISVMMNTLDLMVHFQRPEFDKERRDYLLDRAKKSGLQSIAMIDDMLMVSKMESGLLQPSLTPFSIPDLVAEKGVDFQLQAEREAKTLILSFPDDLPLVLADSQLISRVIDNLVNNAFKYTQHGGEIIIEAERKNDVVEVRIRDDGEGIREEFQEEIFNKFTQVLDKDETLLRQGVGLGLAFCRMAVEANFGRIWVESSPEIGSIFFFTLPVVPKKRPRAT
jgi:K+-sensing histidine kinase KdpD